MLDFQSAWRSVIHHTANQHTWALGHGGGEAGCSHEPLEGEERDKPWLDPGSIPHKALTEVVLDKTFLNNAQRYTNFRLVMLISDILSERNIHYVIICDVKKCYSFQWKLNQLLEISAYCIYMPCP